MVVEIERSSASLYRVRHFSLNHTAYCLGTASNTTLQYAFHSRYDPSTLATFHCTLSTRPSPLGFFTPTQIPPPEPPHKIPHPPRFLNPSALNLAPYRLASPPNPPPRESFPPLRVTAATRVSLATQIIPCAYGSPLFCHDNNST